MLFYDTCSLLKELHNAFKERFFISNITLKELENIKTSTHKDEDAKYRARHVIHLLDEQEKKYEVIDFSSTFLNLIPEAMLEEVNNDIKIIACALHLQKVKKLYVFLIFLFDFFKLINYI